MLHTMSVDELLAEYTGAIRAKCISRLSSEDMISANLEIEGLEVELRRRMGGFGVTRSDHTRPTATFARASDALRWVAADIDETIPANAADVLRAHGQITLGRWTVSRKTHKGY